MSVQADVLMGVRAPRLRSVPAYDRTYGPEVVDLAKLAGLALDPWQSDVMDDFCAVSPSRPNKWNALECVQIVPRQNGKGGSLEAYVLGCLYLFDDPLIMYSAHRFATAREMFIRIKELIEGCYDLRRRVRRVSEAHGKEGIELTTGQRLLFHARSDKAGRGFSGDKNVLDESFLLDAATMSAIMPTMAARPNPQIIYASSSGWEISVQLGKLRRRALASLAAVLAGEGLDVDQIAERLGLTRVEAEGYLRKAAGPDEGLAFLEWSAPGTVPRTRQAMSDRALWAQANPALGIRITEAFIAAELRTMGLTEFARERLGISDYPPDEDEDGGWEVIGEAAWMRRALPGDDQPRPGDAGVRRVAFAVDMRPDRSAAAIGGSFRDEAGRRIVEVINHKAGTGWVVPRLVELHERYSPCAVAVDTVGPASSVIEDLRQRGIEVLELGSSDVAEAWGQFYEAATEDGGDLHHLDQQPLNEAVRGAATRPLGDRQTWDRKGETDISPLVAVTNAAFAHAKTAHESDPLDNIW